MADVAIICGSASDSAIADKAKAILEYYRISFDYQVISAHRDPDKLDAYIKESGCKVFIAIAGLSAALPGVIASKTEKPVIGVPVQRDAQRHGRAPLDRPDAKRCPGRLRRDRQRGECGVPRGADAESSPEIIFINPVFLIINT